MIENYEVVSIVGNAKNAGKTTVLNAIVENYMNRVLAITSIGLDGEVLDNISLLPKPRIFVHPGMIVATAEECLKVCEAQFSIIADTDIQTSLGTIKIIHITLAGYCLIGGPSTIKAMTRLIELLKSMNIYKILIDGAFSRKTLSKVTDACLFAVGAVLSPNIDDVIKSADLTIRQFGLPRISKEYDYLEAKDNVTLIMESGNTIDLMIDSAITNMDMIFESINNETRFIYLPGSLSQMFAKEYIRRRKSKLPSIILKSPTHIVLPDLIFSQLLQMQTKIYVLNTINLIGIAYNPFSPSGYCFDELEFRQKLINITDLPIINVMHESEERHE